MGLRDCACAMGLVTLSDSAEVGVMKIEIFDFVEVLSLLVQANGGQREKARKKEDGARQAWSPTQPCSTFSLAY